MKLVVALGEGEKKKTFFGEVKRETDSKVLIIPHGYFGYEDPVEVPKANVIANIRRPRVGSAFGAYVDPIFEKRTIERVGELYVRGDPGLREKADTVEKEIGRVFKRLRKNNLDIFTPIPFMLSAKHTSMLGCYSFRKDQHAISLFDRSDNDRMFTISHETGHPLWRLGMSSSMKARWIELYYEGVTKGGSAIKEVLKTIQGADSLKAARQDMVKEEKTLVSLLLSWIHKIHHLRADDVDVLIETNKVKPFLPSPEELALYVSSVTGLVTKYSAKNPEELWCEAFATHMTDRKMDKKIEELVERTMRNIAKKNSRGKE